MMYFDYRQGNGPFRIWSAEGHKPKSKVKAKSKEVTIFGDSQIEMPKCDGSPYSDRLYQWDFKKFNELCQKHFGNQGQYWDNRDPEKIEAFLSDYFGYPVKLLQIWQWNNASSGFPLWQFFYNKK